MDNYVPPFTITSVMLEYVSKIMEKVGEINSYTNLNKMPELRKQNSSDDTGVTIINDFTLSTTQDIFLCFYEIACTHDCSKNSH